MITRKSSSPVVPRHSLWSNYYRLQTIAHESMLSAIFPEDSRYSTWLDRGNAPFDKNLVLVTQHAWSDCSWPRFLCVTSFIMIVGCHEIEVSKIGIIIMQGVSCSDLQRGMTPTDLMYAKKAYVSIENLNYLVISPLPLRYSFEKRIYYLNSSLNRISYSRSHSSVQRLPFTVRDGF